MSEFEELNKFKLRYNDQVTYKHICISCVHKD